MKATHESESCGWVSESDVFLIIKLATLLQGKGDAMKCRSHFLSFVMVLSNSGSYYQATHMLFMFAGMHGDTYGKICHT